MRDDNVDVRLIADYCSKCGAPVYVADDWVMGEGPLTVTRTCECCVSLDVKGLAPSLRILETKDYPNGGFTQTITADLPPNQR